MTIVVGLTEYCGCCCWSRILVAVFLEFPFSIVQRAHLTRFQPTWDAVEMECVLHDERIGNNEPNKKLVKGKIRWIMALKKLYVAAKLMQLNRTYITNSPGNGTFFAGGRCLIGLTLDAQIHNMITANSTVIDDNIYYFFLWTKNGEQNTILAICVVKKCVVRCLTYRGDDILFFFSFSFLFWYVHCANVRLGECRMTKETKRK